MNEKEKIVQKHIFNLVKHIQNHVDVWRKSLENIARPLQILENQSEQLIHVARANVYWLDNFEDLRNTLYHRIFGELQNTVSDVYSIVHHLKKVNHELKNKISVLETSSQHLFEDNSSVIIKGSATQPPLERLFKHTLEFYTFFYDAGSKISESFENLDLKDQSTVKDVVNSFKINLNNPQVNYLIAITQYINEKGP